VRILLDTHVLIWVLAAPARRATPLAVTKPAPYGWRMIAAVAPAE
jgi:PIN domain nuclease of toxin-antitoxin system